MEVARAAPPLPRPRYLTTVNWDQFAAHPHSTELAYVQEIQCRQPVWEWFDGPVDIQEMLRPLVAMRSSGRFRIESCRMKKTQARHTRYS